MLARHGKAVGSAEAEPVEPSQRVRHRRAGDAGVSPALVDASTAASLPTEEDARREVEEEKPPPRLCRVARGPHSRGAVFSWRSHSPDTPHASDKDDSDRGGRHRPHARCHLVRGGAPGDRGENQQDTVRYRLVEERSAHRETSHARNGPHRRLIGQVCLDGTACFCR